MKGILLASMILLSSSAGAEELKLPTAAFLAAQALDLHSTRAVRLAGGYEVNPILGQTFAQQAAVKAASSVGAIWLSRKLAKDGHLRAAKVALWSFAGAYAAIAARNYRIAGRVTHMDR